MIIELEPEVEAAIMREAEITPDALVNEALRRIFLPESGPHLVPRDDWERDLCAIGVDCGVSLPDAALSREALYD